MFFSSHLWFENAESCFVTHTLIMIPCLPSEFNIWKTSWALIGAHLDSKTYLGPKNGARQDIQCLKQYLSCLGPILDLTKIFKVWYSKSLAHIGDINNIQYLKQSLSPKIETSDYFFKGAKLLNGCATKISKLDSAFIWSLVFYQSSFALLLS